MEQSVRNQSVISENLSIKYEKQQDVNSWNISNTNEIIKYPIHLDMYNAIKSYQ